MAAEADSELHDLHVREALLRILGLGFGLAVVVGGVIGSGIMRNPGVVAAGFPDAKWLLLAWAVGGIVIVIDAMPTVELGAAIPSAGGPYPLARHVFGPFPGFLIGWADWLQLAISTGFIVVAFGEYVQRLGLLTKWTPGVIGIGLVIACGLIQWIGTRVGGASQDIGSAIKAAGLVILVLILLLAPPVASVAPAPPPPAFNWIAAALAIRAIYGAYGGWHAAVYFSEEVHNPQHNVARATFTGIAIVTALYLLVNAAVVYVLPIGTLANSTLAAADAAKQVIGEKSGIVVTAFAMVAVATLANLQIMQHVRTTFAMARDGILPSRLAHVAPGGTPRASLIVVQISTIVIIAVAGLAKGKVYEVLLNLYAPMVMIVFLALAVGSILLRRREPDLPRPYKMPLYPLPAVLSALINIALLILFVASDWETALWAVALLALAVPLYGRGKRGSVNCP